MTSLAVHSSAERSWYYMKMQFAGLYLFVSGSSCPGTYLRENLEVSLLKKDMRCWATMAEVSCVWDGGAPGPLYALVERLSLIGPPWNVLRT